jgi:hypothetical protein
VGVSRWYKQHQKYSKSVVLHTIRARRSRGHQGARGVVGGIGVDRVLHQRLEALACDNGIGVLNQQHSNDHHAQGNAADQVHRNTWRVAREGTNRHNAKNNNASVLAGTTTRRARKGRRRKKVMALPCRGNGCMTRDNRKRLAGDR